METRRPFNLATAMATRIPSLPTRENEHTCIDCAYVTKASILLIVVYKLYEYLIVGVEKRQNGRACLIFLLLLLSFRFLHPTQQPNGSANSECAL